MKMVKPIDDVKANAQYESVAHSFLKHVAVNDGLKVCEHEFHDNEEAIYVRLIGGRLLKHSSHQREKKRTLSAMLPPK